MQATCTSTSAQAGPPTTQSLPVHPHTLHLHAARLVCVGRRRQLHGVCTSLYSAAPPTSLAVVGLVCFPTAWYAWPVGWGNMASHSHRALQHRPTLARTCRHGSGLAPRPATCPEEYNIHHPGLLRDSHVATTNRKTRSRCMFASALGSRFNSRHCLSDRNSML